MAKLDPTKKHTTSLVSVQFSLKTPSHGRATFAVVKRTVDRSTLRSTNETLNLPQLDAINHAFKTKELTLDSCIRHAKEIIENLYKETGRLRGRLNHTEENKEILDLYWQAEYPRRDIKHPDKAKNRLKLAVDAVGDLSLRSAHIDALQDQINMSRKGNRQRDTVRALNPVLRFLKRSEKLRAVREERRAIRYLTQEEFESLVPHLPHIQQLVFKIAFGTGCRIGEIFALQADELIDDQIQVSAQMEVSGLLSATKTRETRSTIILPEYKKALREWLAIPLEERFKIRNLAWSKICRKACAQAKLRKSCVFHDLRHSFAKHCRACGSNNNDISDALGNSLAVVEKAYSGKVGSTSSLNNLLRAVKQR